MSILQYADTQQPTTPKFMKLIGLDIEPRMIGLIGNQQHRFVDFAQTLGHNLVQARQTQTRIDDEEQQVGFFDAKFDLAFHFGCQVIDVLDSHTTGIDQFEESTVML